MANKQAERARLREMFRIIRKSGLLRGPSPERLRQTVEALGPTYVKFGQILSMRNDLLPDEYCQALVTLRSEMTPIPFEAIRQVIEEAWGEPADHRLAELSETAIGTASIAQVHRAVLPTGERVVLKVQRQGIYETMEQDINLLHALIRRFKRYAPLIRKDFAATMDPDLIIDEIWQTAQEELDFQVEAKNLLKFREANREIKYVTCPKVYEDLSTAKVLVMEEIQGISIDNLDQLAEAGYDAHEIGEKLVENFVRQILELGFFQADPHPGNFVISGGKIAWIDLGMMGHLQGRERELLKRAILGILSANTNEVTDVLLTLAEETRPITLSVLRNEVGLLLSKYSHMPMKDMDLGIMFQEVISVARNHGLKMPGGITMLGRGIMTMQGTLVLIDPEINFIEMMRNHIQTPQFMTEELRKHLRESAQYLLSSADRTLRIPGEFETLLYQAINGELEIGIAKQGQREDEAARRKLGKQFLRAGLCGIFSLTAAVFSLGDLPQGWLGLPWPSWVFLGLALLCLVRIIFHSGKEK